MEEGAKMASVATAPLTLEQRLAVLEGELATAKAKSAEYSDLVDKAIREKAIREKATDKEKEEYKERENHWEGKVKEIKAEIAELRRERQAPEFVYVQAQVAERLVGDMLVELPALEQLTERLTRPIDPCYPVDPSDVQSARQLYRQDRGRDYGGDRNDYFYFLRASPNERVDKKFLRIDFIFGDTTEMVSGQSEDTTHAMITPFVQFFLGGLLKLTNSRWNVRFARNEAEHKRYRTTQDSLRPDWMCYIRNLLVIRGEEKGDTSWATLSDAAEELTSKMDTWNPLFFGELPYVFGYALRGAKFQLYALFPDPAPPIRIEGGASGVRKIPIGKELDLTYIDDKMALLQYMINLVRILQAMEPLVPSEGEAPPLGEAEPIWKRPGSGEYSRLVFEPGFVIKTLVFSEVGPVKYDLDMLEELYKMVKEGKFRHTIRCKPGYPRRVGAEKKSMKLHLFPIGLSVYPKDEVSLHRCLHEILTALSDLHTNGFVHRDVRWPNILRNVDYSWMLIDLDFAARLQDGTAEWPTWTRGLPERNGEEPWTPRHDILQVSMLLSVSQLHWYHGREQLAVDLHNCGLAAEALNVVQNTFPHL